MAYWYYHVPNLVLAALIYLLAARFLLALVSADNAVARLLAASTRPIVAVVGALTPRIVPLPLVILFAIAWLAAIRVALFVAVSATGARLTML